MLFGASNGAAPREIVKLLDLGSAILLSHTWTHVFPVCFSIHRWHLIACGIFSGSEAYLKRLLEASSSFKGPQRDFAGK